MEILPTSTTTQSAAVSSETDTKDVSSDFETFLKMLTVQMKNQDPLDPMDSANFSMQLATFSGVEQQVKTNDLLTALTQQSDALGLAQISDWIGMEALATTSAEFTGNPLDVYVHPEQDADTAFLVVKNNLDLEVERKKISTTTGPVEWTGIGADGQPMLSGSYTFFVESYEGENLLSTKQAEVYAQVAEVNSHNGTQNVTLTTGDTFAVSTITGLRSAQSELP